MPSTVVFFRSNQFAVGEECLQTSQDLQKCSSISDKKLAFNAANDDDKVDDGTEDSAPAESNAIVEKPAHKSGRRIIVK